jgi:hypothetical protein
MFLSISAVYGMDGTSTSALSWMPSRTLRVYRYLSAENSQRVWNEPDNIPGCAVVHGFPFPTDTARYSSPESTGGERQTTLTEYGFGE